MDRRFMFMEKMTPGVCLPLPRGYIHVYDHNIQTSTALKPLSQLKPTLCRASLGSGNEISY